MLNNNAACKHETQYKGTSVMNNCCINGTVTLKYGAIKIIHDIHRIKPYKYNTNIEDINPKNVCDDVNI